MLSFFRRVLRKAYNVQLGFTKVVQCNVCEWSGRRLVSDAWHPHTICPNCGSQLRHRLMVAAMTGLPGLHQDELIKGKEGIHFAPEPIIQDVFSPLASRYSTADLFRDGVDMKLDMCNLPEIENASLDFVIACDVLEHVPDDGRALNELSRILRPGGWAVLTVPQKDGLETTYEDASITSEEGRLQAFGQGDHLRIYGDDFPKLVQQHGFEVTSVDESSFPEPLVSKHVLFPPVHSSHPLATNYRKVFFAQKRAA